jgi:DHA2 family multidrug resistance protein
MLFCVVPVVGMALKDMPEAELRDASGINNLMRNLGGAVGIAVVNTWLIAFAQLHGARLAEALGRGGDAAGALRGLAARFGGAGLDPARSGELAARVASDRVASQALTLAFDDVSRLSAYIFLAGFLILPFCPGSPLTRSVRGAMGH